MTKNEMIENLVKIKKTVFESDAIVDTVWMTGSSETMVEFIDGMLLELGLSVDEVERQTDEYASDADGCGAK